MSVYDIVEGTSDSLQFQLIESGQALDLNNITVTLLIENRRGVTVTNPGTVSVVDADNGRVQFAPTNTSVFNAANGPYYVRWKLTSDTTGKVGYVPTTNRDVWNIIGL